MANLNAENDYIIMNLSDEEQDEDQNVLMDLDLSDEDDDFTLPDDSDYVSDQSEDLEDRICITLNSPQIRALNGQTRHCMVTFYYCTLNEDIVLCASCMINLNDTGASMHSIVKHEIDVFNALCGRSCNNCRLPTYTIFPCHICPMCVAYNI